jgi:hypothetical protein
LKSEKQCSLNGEDKKKRQINGGNPWRTIEEKVTGHGSPDKWGRKASEKIKYCQWIIGKNSDCEREAKGK